MIRRAELTEALRLKNWGTAVVIAGESAGGKKVTWKPPPDHDPAEPLVRLTASDRVVFRDLVFDGDGRCDVLAEISENAIGVTFERCAFHNFRRHGVRLYRANGQATAVLQFLDTRFVGREGAAACVSIESPARRICHSIQFKNCRFEGPAGAGVSVTRAAMGLTFAFCRFHGVGDAIHAVPAVEPGRFQVHVIRNTFGTCESAIRLAQAPADHGEPDIRLQANLFAGCGEMVRLDPVPVPPFAGGSLVWADNAPDPRVDAPVGGVYLRKSFDLSELPGAAWLEITGDNYAAAWVNGREVGRHLGPSAKAAVACVDVSEFLRPGRNCVAVEGVNVGGNSAANNGAFVFARLVATAPGGPRVLTATDPSWKLNPVAQRGWQTPEFDDAAWGGTRALGSFANSLPASWPNELRRKLAEGHLTSALNVPPGNVRSYQCAPAAYGPDVPAERFTLPTRAGDDAKFLRYDADHALARKHGSPGVPPPKPTPAPEREP